MRTFLLFAGILILFISEILRVYFIMPMPGSQQSNTIDIAYFIGKNILWLRIAGLLLFLIPAIQIVRKGSNWKRFGLLLTSVAYGVVFYMFNFVMEADKMFYQPKHKHFASYTNNSIDTNKLVLGVSLNGIAKAYPIQLIGYHHQVVDSVGNTPVIVTYCTVCRTGRVFSPEINGKTEQFRLVGMDHFNAMFEDASTKSWWQQATGTAITGKLKGTVLKEIPSQQVSLSAWNRMYPGTLIMQPDSNFKDKYDKMDSYDKGLSKGSLTRRDSASWQAKSWVVGISIQNEAKAYDWNLLVTNTLIEDSLAGTPIIITLEKDSSSFHAWNRSVNGSSLHFIKTSEPGYMTDKQTGSLWNEDGKCISGPMQNQQLQRIQAYQEFWHSWQTFHPNTKK
ncbi:MAG: DUF3179 domain-containing (seleno)protein [Sediminibacterium sp.]